MGRYLAALFDWAKPILKVRSPVEVYFIFMAVMIPWQSHKIITKGITAFHIINTVLVFAMLASFLLRGPRPRWYFIIPMYVYWLGSVLGMFNSEALAINIYTLSQDLYLYVWFVLLVLLLSNRDRISLLAIAWTLMLIFVLSTEGFLPGVTGDQRLEFTFRNPNRASAYLALSFFVLFHPVIPWVMRILLAVLVFAAVSTTGSAAGYIGVMLGVSVFVWAYVFMVTPRRLRLLHPLGILALALVAISSGPLANKPITTVIGELAPSAENRVERSAGTREEIWAKGLETFWEHPLGIGPASFHKQIETGIGSKGTIELHSDFVAALVERGLIGLIGFLLFLGAVAVAVIKLLDLSSRTRDRDDMIWAGGLAGACAAYLFYSVTHEALHHETLWLLLALVISQLNVLSKERHEGLVSASPGSWADSHSTVIIP